MVLLFILITLVVLAVSISLSEKVIHTRRNSKVTNKSAYENTTYFRKDKNRYYKFFKNSTFRLNCFINKLQGKSKKRNLRIENKERCGKKNDNIIPWPKD